MERWWMQVSVYVYENREGMFEAHLVHSWRGGTGTRRAEMQTEISGGTIKEGRRDSVSIKGIMTLPLFDNLVTSVVVFSFHLNWPGSGSAGLHRARSAEIQTKPTFITWEKRKVVSPKIQLFSHLMEQFSSRYVFNSHPSSSLPLPAEKHKTRERYFTNQNQT